MNPSGFPQYRGMQVHAVPDSDKAFDSSTGRKLPWAYDLNLNAAPSQREPVEKGPFGRGTNRRTRSTLSRSRSKTAEPKREEDRIRAEQLAAEDAVFGSMKKVAREGHVDELDMLRRVETTVPPAKDEATEVMIYGFGIEVQYAALSFYERVSEGTILEDYPREGRDMGFGFNSPHPKGVPLRMDSQRQRLDADSLRKKNRYAGGNHWVKVTFQSKNAAELACASSPHIVRGYLVYAEPYEGRGPGKDEAIPSTQAGAQIANERVPQSFSTRESHPVDGSPSGSSTTATSATATATKANGGSQTSSSNTLDNIFRPKREPPSSRTLPEDLGFHQTPTAAQPGRPNEETRLQQQTPGQETLRRRRISGAKLASVHPVEMTLAPRKAKQSWSAWLLGTGDVIGTTVPKKEDGAFDWEKAGFYWRLFFWLDGILGTDFCGLKAD